MRNPWVTFGCILVCAQLTAGGALAEPKVNPTGDYPAFKPHWGFELGLTSNGTPGDKGGGAAANDLSFTATDEITESGNFFSISGTGGSQKVEGYSAKYGSLSLNGGLGLGVFSPSLSLSAQTGEESLFATTAGLNLGFQIFDDISLGLNFTGGLSSHETPTGIPGVNIEIDGKSLGAGLSFIWATSEIFSLSLNGQTTNEITYQFKLKNQTQSLTFPLANQNSIIPSSSIGFNWAFLKDFALNGSVQRSEEFQPAGKSYSPSLGETVDNLEPTTLFFSGYSVGLTYSFE